METIRKVAAGLEPGDRLTRAGATRHDVTIDRTMTNMFGSVVVYGHTASNGETRLIFRGLAPQLVCEVA